MATPMRVPRRSRSLRDEIEAAEMEEQIVQNPSQDQDSVGQDEMVEAGLVDESDIGQQQQQTEPSTPQVTTTVSSPAQVGRPTASALRTRPNVDDLEVPPLRPTAAVC